MEEFPFLSEDCHLSLFEKLFDGFLNGFYLFVDDNDSDMDSMSSSVAWSAGSKDNSESSFLSNKLFEVFSESFRGLVEVLSSNDFKLSSCNSDCSLKSSHD